MNGYIFIFIAALLNILSKVPTLIWLVKNKRRYNNHNPRKQFQENDSLQKLYAAHTNTMEAFPVFAVAMVIGELTSLAPHLLASIGWIFVLSRLVYILLYSFDLAWQRSVVWAIGWFASLTPIVIAGFKL